MPLLGFLQKFSFLEYLSHGSTSLSLSTPFKKAVILLPHQTWWTRPISLSHRTAVLNLGYAYTRGRFHQCSTHSFYKSKSQKYKKYWRLELLGSSNVKTVLKIVAKSTSGVNFINILCTAFALVDPESVKIQLSHRYLFTLLGSTSVKAVSRTLMKSTPAIDWRS